MDTACNDQHLHYVDVGVLSRSHGLLCSLFADKL